MSEIYSLKERILIFSTIYAVSLVASIIYFCLHVGPKNISVLIFIPCLIYASFFFFLNIIAMYDLVFTNTKGCEKFGKTISKFYFISSLVDKLLRHLPLFDITISYMESGHFNCCMRMSDFVRRKFNSLIKCNVEMIIKVLINILSITIFIVLIICRKNFDLTAIECYEIVSDCYSIIEIYSCVGYFLIQIFIDCKKQGDRILILRYYRYSITKIIENTEKYTKKLKKSFEILNQAVKNIDRNDKSQYSKFLKKHHKECQKYIKFFELERNNENPINLNNRNNNNGNNSPDFSNYNYDVYDRNRNLNNFENNYRPNNMRNQIRIYNEVERQQEQSQRRELKEETRKEAKEEKKYDIPTSIRKYKNSVRRINKLKKLYEEIENEKDKDLERLNENKKCSWHFYILFIAFTIIIFTDFLVPIIANLGDNNIDDDDEEYEKESPFGLFVGVLLSTLLSIICNSYTIVRIFSTTKRVYISGDFLYDKQINDNLSLLKTVQIICGNTFALVYCNLYYWIALDARGDYGKPYFYEETYIPDYKIISGLSVYMIVKVVIIIVSIIGSFKCSKFFLFENDLAEYNLSQYGCDYDSDDIFNRMKKEKKLLLKF